MRVYELKFRENNFFEKNAVVSLILVISYLTIFFPFFVYFISHIIYVLFDNEICTTLSVASM